MVHVITKQRLVVSSIIALFSVYIACSKSSSSSALSKLTVAGNRIVTEEGKDIRLRGISVTDPFVMDKDDMNLDGVPDRSVSQFAVDFGRVKALGANSVRLPIYPGFYFLVGESYLSTYVDPLVDFAEKNGLYLIISYQVIGRPGGFYESAADSLLPDYPAKVHYTDTDMAVRFWENIAARYGKKNHVLFEMYNEPIDKTAPYTWADWRPTGELLIATIRKNSSNIILGPGVNYSGDLTDVPKNPYSDSNLVYVAHIYPGNVSETALQVSEWERLFGFLGATYPVIVSEWGFNKTGDETTKGTLEAFGIPFVDYLDQKNFNWIAFTYHPPDAEPPMLESDWVTLNEFGKLVKERLQK